eukprot:TRINITY_DN12894_c0_g3_i1.p1 TRINITY_DN12894_c0_g3~~TRINITY_DN12894_c0_g3_i1.p1  ORF type:complete len:228 (-),score=47.71 TRINITY_DN12894_c0_g3_i1:245-928(-)
MEPGEEEHMQASAVRQREQRAFLHGRREQNRAVQERVEYLAYGKLGACREAKPSSGQGNDCEEQQGEFEVYSQTFGSWLPASLLSEGFGTSADGCWMVLEFRTPAGWCIKKLRVGSNNVRRRRTASKSSPCDAEAAMAKSSAASLQAHDVHRPKTSGRAEHQQQLPEPEFSQELAFHSEMEVCERDCLDDAANSLNSRRSSSAPKDKRSADGAEGGSSWCLRGSSNR